MFEMIGTVITRFLEFFSVAGARNLLFRTLAFCFILTFSLFAYLVYDNFKFFIYLYTYRPEEIKDMERSLTLHNKIEADLRKRLDRLNADRLTAVRFYTSGKDFTNNDIIYVSKFLHVLIGQINHDVIPIERIPLVFWPNFEHEFSNNNCSVVYQMDQTVAAYQFWAARGAKSLVACPFRSIQGNITGFLLAEYVTAPMNRSESISIQNLMSDLASSLGGALYLDQGIVSFNDQLLRKE